MGQLAIVAPDVVCEVMGGDCALDMIDALIAGKRYGIGWCDMSINRAHVRPHGVASNCVGYDSMDGKSEDRHHRKNHPPGQ